MKHVDTLTVLRTANSLVELADQVETTARDKLNLKHVDWTALQELLRQVRAHAAAMLFVQELPEPAALASAFRLKRAKRKTRRHKHTPKKPL